MTATQKFIEDAIEGGWENRMQLAKDWVANGMYFEVLLDPLAWQAVGRTRVWGHGRERLNWKNNWLAFIQYLADGKSIEEALTAIS